MTKKKGGGKKTTKGGSGGDDEIISLTPTPGFDIRKVATQLRDMMIELGQPLIIYMPKVAVEFEPGCTRKQIIDGYNQGLRASTRNQPANQD